MTTDLLNPRAPAVSPAPRETAARSARSEGGATIGEDHARQADPDRDARRESGSLSGPVGEPPEASPGHLTIDRRRSPATMIRVDSDRSPDAISDPAVGRREAP